jgi:4-amino-4-deoxy-L-arabinose transferase-like glycosyltransferase
MDNPSQTDRLNAPGNASSLSSWFSRLTLPDMEFAWESLLVILLAAYFLAYGLVPLFGGDKIGLVGADEPRYAQVAREMLVHHDYVTPILYGMPWLEKPALFYWRAMFSFEEFGIHDWAARLPSTSFAFALVVLVFLHMRRFRPGGHLHAALITASCAGIIAFARGASTDMQLAAPVCIGLLGWYAWYETGSKFWLFDLYFFVAAGTLAKGPIAPAIALTTIIAFAALRREWSLLKRSLWIPGILLYFIIVLPWYIAVQKRNPEFLRVFFLQHNLERFATDRFHHHQPGWYYIPILLLALVPWTVLAGAAFVDAVEDAVQEWRARRNANRYLWLPRAGDAFPEFLVLWALIPLVFFSFSGSKLPGYILPSIPAVTILTGDYLGRMRLRGLPRWLVAAHALFMGTVTTAILLLPAYVARGESWPSGRPVHVAAFAGAVVALFMLAIGWRAGVDRLRTASLVPIVLLLYFLIHLNGGLIDHIYSARPLAIQMQQLPASNSTVAVYNTRRDIEYGLAFYRNQRIVNYRNDGIPLASHLLVARAGSAPELDQLLGSRQRLFLIHDAAQDLDVFWISPAVTPSATP